MKVKTLLQSGFLLLLVASPAAFAKEVIHTFKAHGKKYEIYVGYADAVYVTYAGSTDTKYKKGRGSKRGGCDWISRPSGACASYSEMISKIKYKVRNHDY